MNAKKWTKRFALSIFLIVVLPYSFSYLDLSANYENNSYTDIVSRQISNNSLYGTALNQNTFQYKLELVRKVKPDIVALGSSRVMRFRKESFNTSFITVGGAMNQLNEGIMFLEQMYKFHKPKYIILGLDFWWFNESFPQHQSYSYHSNPGNTLYGEKVYKSFSYLLEAKVPYSSVLNIFSRGKIKNSFSNYDSLGFSAISTSNGFRSDGSYLYYKTIFGLQASDDVHFKETLARIKTGGYRFEHASHISATRIAQCNELLRMIEENGTKVIVFIPPLADAANNAMSEKDYAYIDEFRTYVLSLPHPAFDYSYLSSLSSNDCECIDGIHAGDVVYLRMLLDIFKSNKAPEFNKFINTDQLKGNIARFMGKAFVVAPNETFSGCETDFLKLGCDK